MSAREAFEAWVLSRDKYNDLARLDSSYRDMDTRFAWDAWHAADAAGRAAAFEEAAVVCRALGDKIVKRLEGLSEDMGDYSKARAWDYMQCAIAIRALVEGNAPPEGRG